MPAAASEAEVNGHIAALAECDDDERRLVVRNGSQQPRKGTTEAGAVEVKAPWVTDKRVDEATGEGKWATARRPRARGGMGSALAPHAGTSRVVALSAASSSVCPSVWAAVRDLAARRRSRESAAVGTARCS